MIAAFAQGGRGGGGDSGERNRRPGGGGGQRDWSAVICANSTTAQNFLTQTRAVITTLQNNGSYTQFLADRINAVTYIQNAGNDATLTSNCTAYISGLNAARAADRVVLDARRQLEENAVRLLAQVVQSLVGSRGNLNGYY